jgi:hypothetical protein
MRTGFRFSAVVAVILAGVIVSGCSTAIKATAVTYTYEPRASFAEMKTYRWADPRPRYRQDTLLESNVRFLADRALEAKGLTSKTDKADLLVWIGYEFEYSSYGSGYELNMLTLNVSRADNNQLVWRGMATGSIKTDAASDDLKKAVEGMLGNFPPK